MCRRGRWTGTSRRFTGASPRSPTAPSPPTSPSSPRSTPISSALPSPRSTAGSTPSATPTRPFTIQSISKAFVYGYTLAEYGRDYVLSRIGVEPTGEAFNSIVLDEVHNRPFNPMVNAGAMAAAELIKGDNPEARIATMLAVLSRFAGRSLLIDDDGLSLRAGDRPPQPRHRLYDAQLGHDPCAARDHPRHLFPAMLGAGDLRRSRGDGGDARQ